MSQQNVIPIANHFEIINKIRQYLNQHILGQEQLINRLLVALLADGHLLVEGAPGLAKTKAVKVLASCLEGSFHRVQFTPDLLPADITGTDVYQQETGTFKFQPGPVFHNIVLTDEINRAPAKVQSALLEAMEERQITIGRQTYPLPDLFLVMATQNPIEQEGTYPLPEAQLDRFLMFTKVDYPHADVEQKILQLNLKEQAQTLEHQTEDIPVISEHTVHTIRKEVLDIHLSPALETYIVQLVLATRRPESYGLELKQWLRFGASPRGTIALARCAKAYAWLKNRDYVSPDDIEAVVYDVLRHRLILSFDAEAEGLTPDDVIKELIRRVAVP